MKSMENPNMEINENNVLVKYNGQDEIVVVPEGIEKIGSSAFSSNDMIREVILPDSLLEIGNYAFDRSCLEKIHIPESVKKIGYCAFQYCKKLRDIVLPCNLENIEMSVFMGCTDLKYLKLPPNLKKVDQEAFDRCGIVELDIPDSMTYIGKKSFCYMKNLEKLHLPSSLKGIGEEAFSFCGSLKEVCIPEGVVKIEYRAFDACTNLEKVIFPKSLISIDKGAFSRTKIENSEEIQEIYRKLALVTVYKKPFGWKEMAFDGLNFYYYRSVEMYQEDNYKGIPIDDFIHDHDITDTLSIFRTKEGRMACMIYVSVPTFDSGDREWDSYRKLFLIPADRRVMEPFSNKMTGIMVYGGYRIAKILVYHDILWADDKTKQLLKVTEIFG